MKDRRRPPLARNVLLGIALVMAFISLADTVWVKLVIMQRGYHVQALLDYIEESHYAIDRIKHRVALLERDNHLFFSEQLNPVIQPDDEDCP